ncbi:hypothetical protein [Streptomyces sp. NPDC048269]|uniref:hypothetical protein n=1 Tax=Streptomyces sp. NPDC048269 TaxID=3155753 RepID=UPI0034136A2E
MTAPTHTRTFPSGPRAGARGAVGARHGADARLHWWALALPALAFGLLLILLAGSGGAHAATGEATGLIHVTQQLLRVVG